MGKRSRDKGKRGELEAAQELRELGFQGARRGQQFKGGPDSPDVVDAIPGVHLEVKRTEALSLYPAMNQAACEAGEGDISCVLHRRNSKEWLAIVPLKDLVPFAYRVLDARRLVGEE